MDDIQASYVVAAQLHGGVFDQKRLKVTADKIHEALQVTRSEHAAREALEEA